MSEEIKDKNLTQIGEGVETLIDDPNWKTYKIMRKMATGQGINNQIIDLRNYSNGVDWKNTKICVGLNKISLNTKTTTIVSNYNKIDDNSFKIIAYTDNTIYTNEIKETVLWYKGSKVIEYKGTDFFVFYSDDCGLRSSVEVERSFGKNGVYDPYLSVYSGHGLGGKSEEFHFEGNYDSIRFRLSGYGDRAKVALSIHGGTKSSVLDIQSNTVEWLAYEE